jgi:hypothetical protein
MKSKTPFFKIILIAAATLFAAACNSNDDTGTNVPGGSSANATGVSAVEASTSTTCSSLTGVPRLLCLCDEFESSLSATQIATLEKTYNFTNIKTWSNLPAAMSPRLGLRLGDLTTAQIALAKAIIKEMSGTTIDEGYDEVQQLFYADDYLNANGGGSTYGSGNFYLAFFGSPSAVGIFEIMLTGHHKTVANTYKDGALVSATPHFAAVEPTSFARNGTTYAPIDQEKDAFAAILTGLTAGQLATAKSSSTFTDILLGPNSNWAFPTTHSGLHCSSLNAIQKLLVLNAIKTYVYDIDDTNAATIFAAYSAEIDNTYILYSGTATMTNQADYFRIDGPHVWIEFSAQHGIVLPGVHYHSVWRDKENDYGTTH